MQYPPVTNKANSQSRRNLNLESGQRGSRKKEKDKKLPESDRKPQWIQMEHDYRRQQWDEQRRAFESGGALLTLEDREAETPLRKEEDVSQSNKIERRRKFNLKTNAKKGDPLRSEKTLNQLDAIAKSITDFVEAPSPDEELMKEADHAIQQFDNLLVLHKNRLLKLEIPKLLPAKPQPSDKILNRFSTIAKKVENPLPEERLSLLQGWQNLCTKLRHREILGHLTGARKELEIQKEERQRLIRESVVRNCRRRRNGAAFSALTVSGVTVGVFSFGKTCIMQQSNFICTFLGAHIYFVAILLILVEALLVFWAFYEALRYNYLAIKK